MRWADAARVTGKAERLAKGDDEPNVLLREERPHAAPVFKAFRAREQFGWRRVKLALADKHDDWESVERISWETVR